MSTALTEEMILSKTGAKSLDQVCKLNICGFLLDDVSVLQRLPNVEVLSLSVNNISSLRHFSSCKMLKELYLRKNQVGSLDEVEALRPLTNLRVLWLTDNPCASQPGYREHVLSVLPSLVKLDGTDVSHASAAGPSARSPVPDPLAGVGMGPQGLGGAGAVQAQGHGMSGAAPGGKSMNVLYAVIALLRELDEEGLRVVKVECENRLGLGPAGVQ